MTYEVGYNENIIFDGVSAVNSELESHLLLLDAFAPNVLLFRLRFAP